MKTCFKCGVNKPIGEFYAHPRMKDGHLNKCKSCTRRDTALRHERKSADPTWLASELIRHRAKSEKYRMEGRAPKSKPESQAKWAKLNWWKRKAHQALNNAVRDGKVAKQPCVYCGNPKSDGHHEDYSKPLDVIWLCRKHHGYVHHLKTISKLLGSTKREAV